MQSGGASGGGGGGGEERGIRKPLRLRAQNENTLIIIRWLK